MLEGGQVVELDTAVLGGGGYLQRDHIEESVGSAVADAADRCTGETGEIARAGVNTASVPGVGQSVSSC